MTNTLFTLAHVKWFTGVAPGTPEPVTELLNPWFLGALGLSLFTMLILVRLNLPLQEIPWVQRIHTRLEEAKPYTLWILRVGLALPLVAAGLGDYLFHYELAPIAGWISLAQIGLGIAILVPGLDRFAAVGVAGLGLFGAVRFGMHPLIDYVSWLGACYYIITRGHGTAIPVLYITTGISLAWAAVEKWVFPHMALDIIAHHGIPTFGFPAPIFLILAGWVELSVGYLMITGVLNRFLSLVVTGLFVTTTMVFGEREIVGHWQLHAALLVFLVEGTGKLITPVLWHRGGKLQMAFVGVTLLPFVAGMIGLYYLL